MLEKYPNFKIWLLAAYEEMKKVFYFPGWWYTKGLFKVVKGCANVIRDFELSLGLSIWVKNLFVPMFGQRDFAGRLISFFLRLAQIIGRGVIILILIILNVIFIIIWLVLPIFIIYQIIINI